MKVHSKILWIHTLLRSEFISLFIQGDLDDLKQDVSSFRYDVLNKLNDQQDLVTRELNTLSNKLDNLAITQPRDLHPSTDKKLGKTDLGNPFDGGPLDINNLDGSSLDDIPHDAGVYTKSHDQCTNNKLRMGAFNRNKNGGYTLTKHSSVYSNREVPEDMIVPVRVNHNRPSSSNVHQDGLGAHMYYDGLVTTDHHQKRVHEVSRDHKYTIIPVHRRSTETNGRSYSDEDMQTLIQILRSNSDESCV